MKYKYQKNGNGEIMASLLNGLFKNIKSGNSFYIVFTRRTFNLLIYTLVIGMVSNLILIYQMSQSPILAGGLNTVIYFIIFFLCISAIAGGIWLAFKGIDIVTDDDEGIQKYKNKNK